ncbi:hypothetical protein BGW36DRAFT_302515 [Talaromyces proteolyticus]|uniref:DUF3824 domain-containing protein n=1 Tax=Talaromyces proteolyticus TaxID=1131652 RepID=A0AAD4KPP1_9EURO|nr:uncharacterized protein BGW36DRAFT_302515 [Talaromyces proteolyticus]KAH8693201.1 hypothetical protein BGW36DRAFT_302515 [Talaromyces proteolyticus]
MSYYDTRDSRGYRVKRDRYSRPGGGYVEETYVDNRGGYGREMDLVRRRDSQESVVEEVTRDFPPGEPYYGYPRPRRTMSVREGARRARSAGRDPYYDEEYYRREDYAPRKSKRYRDDRHRHDRRSSYSSSRSPSPRPRRRKSLGEQALGAIGGALGVKAARDRSRSRSKDRYEDRGRSRRYRSYSDSRSRSRGGRRAKSEARVAQAVKAALAAGAAEAFRARKDPGPWTGDKGKRILTAAITAGGVDGLIDRDPNKHGGRHVVESILAGMATNHLVNGRRSGSRSGARGQSRGRSQSQGGGIKDMAAAGVLAAAGKQVYDRVRSKSRGRSRSDSRDGYDDRGHGDSKKRGSSVSRAINKGLAALGLDDKNKDDRRQERSSRYSDYSDSGDESSYRSSRHRYKASRDVRSQQAGSNTSSRALANRAASSNGNVDCHSDCDRLAAVATIHAAHSVVKNFEAQKRRRQEVKEGAITKEQESKMRMKANLKSAASIGLAGLGIKGAIGEWKEVDEQRKEHKEFLRKCKERHEKRVMKRNGSMNTSGSGSSRRSQSLGTGAARMNVNDYENGHGGSHYYHDENPYNAGYSFDY